MIKNQEGQSVIEYVLLFAVMSVIILTLFNTPLFKDFFSSESKIFTQFRTQWEHGYRHGYDGYEPYESNASSRYQKAHSSYNYKGASRFFFTLKYPK